MAPSEEQKIRWGVGLLAALLLVVALASGEITWTGDGIRIGMRRPPAVAKPTRF